jgi:hypothetical protein
METDIQTSSDPVVGESRPLFQFGVAGVLGNSFGVSTDGQRFLVADPIASKKQEAPHLTVVVDWLAELGK